MDSRVKLCDRVKGGRSYSCRTAPVFPYVFPLAIAFLVYLFQCSSINPLIYGAFRYTIQPYSDACNKYPQPAVVKLNTAFGCAVH